MMKRFLLISLFSSCLMSGMAQTAPKKPTAPAKPAAAPPLALKNTLDSFSYAIGLSIANFYKEQGITQFNTAQIQKAIADHKAGKPLLDENQSNTAIMNYVQLKKSEKSAATRKQGQAFLAENKKKAGVITTATGLQYTILKEGSGEKPKASDKVKVHYHGTLIDGTIFDSSVERGEPIVLGVEAVIPGWVEALQLMPVGSKWRLFIPSNLAYGDNDAGPVIKGGSALIFDVELIEIEKNQ